MRLSACFFILFVISRSSPHLATLLRETNKGCTRGTLERSVRRQRRLTSPHGVVSCASSLDTQRLLNHRQELPQGSSGVRSKPKNKWTLLECLITGLLHLY